MIKKLFKKSKIYILRKYKKSKIMKRNSKLEKKDTEIFNNLGYLIENDKTTLNTYSHEFLQAYFEAIKSTDVIQPLQKVCVNLDGFNRFLKNVNSNINDYIRIISYGIEGQLKINSLIFSKNKLRSIVIWRDAPYSMGKVTVFEYEGKSIKKTEEQSTVKYYLVTQNNDLELLLICSDKIFSN